VDTPKQFYASDGDGGSFEVLEAQHGTGSGFDPAMILFDQVVQVLRGSWPDLRLLYRFALHCL